eukprot:c11910_g1_i2.p1 GENE.c11910_g1_i2~~c11910_g1_i2.p1  ORF type:complete len:560 (+),score=115.29 c11910_g1_i2:26-1705(+)
MYQQTSPPPSDNPAPQVLPSIRQLVGTQSFHCDTTQQALPTIGLAFRQLSEFAQAAIAGSHRSNTDITEAVRKTARQMLLDVIRDYFPEFPDVHVYTLALERDAFSQSPSDPSVYFKVLLSVAERIRQTFLSRGGTERVQNYNPTSPPFQPAAGSAYQTSSAANPNTTKREDGLGYGAGTQHQPVARELRRMMAEVNRVKMDGTIGPVNQLLRIFALSPLCSGRELAPQSSKVRGALEFPGLKSEVDSASPPDGKPKISRPKSTKSGRFACPECGVKFSNPQALGGHRSQHTRFRFKQLKDDNLPNGGLSLTDSPVQTADGQLSREALEKRGYVVYELNGRVVKRVIKRHGTKMRVQFQCGSQYPSLIWDQPGQLRAPRCTGNASAWGALGVSEVRVFWPGAANSFSFGIVPEATGGSSDSEHQNDGLDLDLELDEADEGDEGGEDLENFGDHQDSSQNDDSDNEDSAAARPGVSNSRRFRNEPTAAGSKRPRSALLSGDGDGASSRQQELVDGAPSSKRPKYVELRGTIEELKEDQRSLLRKVDMLQQELRSGFSPPF